MLYKEEQVRLNPSISHSRLTACQLLPVMLTAVSQSGLGVASIRIVPSIAGASGEGQVGGIYVANDLGYHLTADHNIVFNVRIDKSNFIH